MSPGNEDADTTAAALRFSCIVFVGEAPVMGRPGDEIAAGARGHGRLRVSHDDREQVIDVLKVAFVQGRLTKDELDGRAGQALVARTYAELAAVTADIPAGPDLAQPPKPARAQPNRPESRAEKWAIRSGVGAITALMVAGSAWAVAVGQPEAIGILAVLIFLVATVATAFAALVVSLVRVLAPESRRRERSGGQLPPRSGSGPGGQASPRPVSADPAGQLPPVDHGQRHWALTLKRQVAYSRKYSNAGAQPLAWATADTMR